ncbi:type II toxin-antitoxin system RelE/ParE family toxin [Aeromonas veronii]|uniref:type II toxin-antitoxin system RelE/ParE family toxin n=1 Tax=Aeromonas TaxID=642 RepID=UPI000DE5BC28|nr:MULTISPECIES: type II toxin-antitoxin system RelE/ParE family toxin [Aeromonas]MBL0476296.1 type II toxin-antitoxin system RelE/ParE family toxin [Aeromonas veronii]MCF5842757.1 type II toxin-antitoxin system RelE/ParE family toxin [Aeromonas veronii]QXB28654.1 type II toxin-antitoxin system RelE/ParE family toxin [Aeromonas sp. FDAARGOS 1405]
MSEEQNEIEVFESSKFTKQLKKLSDDELKAVEDEIERVIDDPEIGEQKKGDLSYLRVHKFKLNGQLVLLGYSWKEAELQLYLLSIGPHENFYDSLKERRKADLKLIG